MAFELSQAQLKSEVSYDTSTGLFTRNDTGLNCGYVSEGYLRTSVLGNVYYVHRLAWLYVYGEFPTKQIDHINQCRSDNRIENLREVTNKENMKNSTKRADNKSGQVGVSWHKARHKWRAFITVDGKQISLGYYLQYHEAVDARKLAEVAYGFHENHGSI